jgi:hypothetical protein
MARKASKSVDKQPVLTQAEAEDRILTVLRNPDHIEITAPKIAMLADVPLKKTYEILSRPDIKNIRREVLMEFFQSHLRAVAEAMVDSAKMIGNEGVRDRKLLMQMLDIYQETQEVKHIGDPEKPVSFTLNIATPRTDEGDVQQTEALRKTGGVRGLPGPVHGGGGEYEDGKDDGLSDMDTGEGTLLP